MTAGQPSEAKTKCEIAREMVDQAFESDDPEAELVKLLKDEDVDVEVRLETFFILIEIADGKAVE